MKVRHPLVIAIATVDGLDSAHIDTETLTATDEAAVRSWLADPLQLKILYDAKPTMHLLAKQGWVLEGITNDVALSAYLDRPGGGKTTLAALAQHYLPPAQPADGCGEEEVIARLAMHFDTLKAPGQNLLTDVELPVQRVLAGLESVGIAVDDAYLRSLQSRYAAEIDTAARSAFAALGHPVNLGSPKELQVVLFDELGMPKTKKTKTGYTTDA
ncbi:DNA polymerase, partial [Mycobacteroides abscessus]|uniref:DNA polymerase n=1 Tax=Mycobacteroides abscessus TaxID=36809 RepID=UPI001EED4006